MPPKPRRVNAATRVSQKPAQAGARPWPRRAPARKRRVLHEEAVAVEQRLARACQFPHKTPVGLQDPALRLVGQVRGHDLAHDLLLDGGIHDLDQRLDPAHQIAHIQSADDMKTRAFFEGRPCPLPKQTIRLCSRKRPTIDLTRMFSLRPRYAGAHPADAAHDKADLHPRLAGGIERVDHIRLDQAVHLGPDRGGPPRPRMLGLAAIMSSRRDFRLMGEMARFSSPSGCT